MKKQTPVIIGICILFLLATGLLLWHKQPAEESAEEFFSLEQSIGTDTGAISADSALAAAASGEPGPAATPDCAVYLSGAIKKPGLYHYYGSARLSDAVEARGGFSKSAAKEAVNLARLLVDGEQIHIPTKKEAASSQGQNTEKGTQVSGENAGELVNINTAPSSELQTLPGIGASRAEAIIAYRTEHGSFTDKKDLMEVSGIKEGIFQKIEALIIV